MQYVKEIFQKILQLIIWKRKKTTKKTKKKQNRIKRNCNFFSVDFSSIDTNDISDIHKYLMKKT